MSVFIDDTGRSGAGVTIQGLKFEGKSAVGLAVMSLESPSNTHPLVGGVYVRLRRWVRGCLGCAGTPA